MNEANVIALLLSLRKFCDAHGIDYEACVAKAAHADLEQTARLPVIPYTDIEEPL